MVTCTEAKTSKKATYRWLDKAQIILPQLFLLKTSLRLTSKHQDQGRSLKWMIARKWTVRLKVKGLKPKWTIMVKSGRSFQLNWTIMGRSGRYFNPNPSFLPYSLTLLPNPSPLPHRPLTLSINVKENRRFFNFCSWIYKNIHFQSLFHH